MKTNEQISKRIKELKGEKEKVAPKLFDTDNSLMEMSQEQDNKNLLKVAEERRQKEERIKQERLAQEAEQARQEQLAEQERIAQEEKEKQDAEEADETAEQEKEENLKQLHDNLVAQAVKEIQWARRYKQGKIKNWQKNEEMYYGKKIVGTEARANVDLSRMQEFVHTLLSKIDNPLLFKFTKKKESQLKRVKRLNSLVSQDRTNDNWDIKDLAGKKQAIIYGRAIYSYYADSLPGVGYKPHLENVDVYDFLIDPAGGGLDLEKARFMGDYGVDLTKSDLLEGVEKKNFIKESVDLLVNQGTANNTEMTQEQTNKNVRMYGQNTLGQKELQTDDKYRFWRWFTTYYNPETKKSERYYLLMQERGARAIRIEKLDDLFTPTKEFPKGAWPYWSWAAFLDLTEFWTPSYCDYSREIFMAQHVSINQGLDNAEQINKPQKVVNVTAVENLAELKYRRDGQIKVKGDWDVNKAYQTVVTPSIDTPIKMFDLLESIVQKSSGVSAIEAGTAKSDDKVGIYQGNEAQNADRFGLLNKSYSFGYTRFAKLYLVGIKDNLDKRVAIEMLGPDGVEQEEVKRSDIFRKSDEFGTLIEASNAEVLSSIRKQEAKLAFLSAHAQDPMQNPKKAYEVEASVSGFDKDEIRELMDTSEFGNQELMSDAAKDIEALLEGEEVPLNQEANNAYRQKLLDFMQSHLSDTSDKQKQALMAYMDAIEPIVMRNEARALNAHAINVLSKQALGIGAGQDAGTSEPVPEANGTMPNNNNPGQQNGN